MRKEVIGNATLYLGDCLEIMPSLQGVDALLTDPPYGVGLGSSDQRGGDHGLAKEGYVSYDDSYENYCEIVPPAISMALGMVKRGAVFCGPHITEMPKPAAVGGVFCPAATGRHRWGFNSLATVLYYGTDPALHIKGPRPTVLNSSAQAEQNGHPCPKPLPWMTWLVDRISIDGETILDPFMGSGTTAVACHHLSRPFVGIEVEPKYFDIACQRIENAQRQERLFA